MQFPGSFAAEARTFAERWLPAWNGDDPERLAYFRGLLARNPFWHASLPVGTRVVELDGVCTST